MSVIPQEIFEKFAMEYQDKIQENSKQLNLIRSQLQAKERDRKLCQLTATELAPMASTTTSYRSVGKMFVLEDLEVLKQTLAKKIGDGSKEIEALQKVALSCDGELKEAQKNMDSLVKKVTEQHAAKA